MKFTCNTKPIVSGLELGIIKSNITKFYQKSCVVELTLEDTGMRVNTEVASVKSELLFRGSVSGEGNHHVFVDSLIFKDLMSSIDSDVVEFEFTDNGLVVYSGKSHFNLPQVVSSDDMELSRPQNLMTASQPIGIDRGGWEFIKDQQMYAIAMSFIHPVYTNVWLSESGDVIVGDYDNSIFTHSGKAQLSSTCLITDTIVNLLTTVPENSKIIQLGRNYEIRVDTDPYSYTCEFAPKYEDDDGIGDYSSSIILGLFDHGESGIKIDTEKVLKFISQAELFTATNEDTIDLKVTQDVFALYNENVDCKIPVNNDYGEFSLRFKISLLKDVLAHMDSSEISICPLIQNEGVVGVIFWTDNMEVVLSGVSEVE